MILLEKQGEIKENNGCLCVLDHRSGKLTLKGFLGVKGEESDTFTAILVVEVGFKVYRSSIANRLLV